MNINSLTKILDISDFRIYQEYEWIKPFISLYFKEKDRVEKQFFSGNGFKLFGLYSYNPKEIPALATSSKELFVGYRFIKDSKSNECYHPFFLTVYQHTNSESNYKIHGFSTEIVTDQRFSRLLLLDKIIDYNYFFELTDDRDFYRRHEEEFTLGENIIKISENTENALNELNKI